jgi:regulator of protease activity HflC (stomatin/prohibitin superfamily)
MTLSEIVEALLKFFPRLEIVEPDQIGVLRRCGKIKRQLSPGVVFCYPYFDEVFVCVAAKQILHIQEQSIKTLDGKIFAVSGAVLFIVEDPSKAIIDIDDLDEYLGTELAGRISDFISLNQSTEINNESLKKNLMVPYFRQKIRDESGIVINKVFVHDLVPHKIIRLMNTSTRGEVE